MAQIIQTNGGGGGGGKYTAGCGIDITCGEISVDTSVIAQSCDIPTDNCQLANGCGYTTCTGTVVASDLNAYQKSACMVCTLTGADNDHYPSAKAVADAITGGGNGDVMGPAGATDGDVVLFDGNTGKMIKDSGVSLSCKQDTLTAGANIDLTCAKVSATNTYIVTESISCTTYTGELGVAPYNTSYCYTNICIDPASGIKWQEGSIYTFDINTEMLAPSACRNVRVKIGDGDYIPVMGTSSILAGCTYFTKANIRQYQYSTKYKACGALHLFSDSNTTYTSMSATEASTGTCTCARTIAACNLKCAINKFAPISDTAYGAGWNACTTTAPSQHAVYAKVNAIDELIPVDATCSNQLADKDYVNDSINSVTAYYITKNAQGDQFACYAELAAATTFYSGGVQRTPTRNDYTIVADDECYNDATTRYLYNSGWEFQYCINESPMTTAQLNAINSGITSAKVTCYDSCMAQCCDIPTDNCQLSNGCGYVTSAAIPTDNCQLANSCGYTTCTGTLSSGDLKTVNCCSLVGSGDITINPGITKIFTLADTSDLVNAQAAYDYAINGGNPIIRVGTSTINHYWESTTSSEAKFTNWIMGASGATTNGQWGQMRGYVFTLSSGTVTAVTNIVKTIFIKPTVPTTDDKTAITLVV